MMGKRQGMYAPTGVMDGKCHVFPLRVYYEDTDAGGVMYYARYFYFAERARSEFLRCCSVAEDMHGVARHEGCVFVVVHVCADYRMPAMLHDCVMMETSLCGVKRASFEMRQILRREEDMLFDARVKLACVSAESMDVKALPEKMFSVLSRMVSP